jgi:hypothetical protein
MKGWSGVCRDVQARRVRERGRAKETRDAEAPRCVRLKAVDDADEVAKVRWDVGVLTGGDVHAGGRALADELEPVEVGRADRLFEPSDSVFGEPLGEGECLLRGVGAVGVDEELGGTDRLPRSFHPQDVGLGLASYFHLDACDSVGDPAAQLLLETSG